MSGKVGFDEFMKPIGSGSGKWSDWKKVGVTTGWIHPKIGIYSRVIHGVIPTVEEDAAGNQTVRKRRFNCAGGTSGGCPLCILEEFAASKIADGMEKDTTVLGRGENRVTLADLAGQSTFMRDTRAKEDHLFAWIPKTGRTAERQVEIITAGVGLHKAIQGVVSSMMQDHGSEKGNPLKHPYAMKLTYNEREPNNSLKYKAFYNDSAIDDEVREIMTADAADLDIDLDKLCAPSSPDEILSGISGAWTSDQVSFEEFETYYHRRGGKAARKVPEPKEKPVAGRTEPKKGGAVLMCPSCKEKVTPNKYGRCPNCAEKIAEKGIPAASGALSGSDDDVPF